MVTIWSCLVGSATRFGLQRYLFCFSGVKMATWNNVPRVLAPSTPFSHKIFPKKGPGPSSLGFTKWGD